MPALGDQHRATTASVNPFEETVNRVSEYTAQEIATLQSRLDKQLGPEYISSRPGNGGAKVHYVAAEKVINLANEVFGFNGWSSQIQNVQIDFCDESQASGKITLGLSIIVRVTLRDGTFHEDIGYGHIENCKGKAAAFEKAKKEAATDAMKRALRNFGNVLGNCLYDKDYLARVAKLKVAPSKWDAENLHRHPDYAPTKREQTIEPDQEEKPASLPTSNSMNSFGGEFEDEFGANFFDGVELAPDDMTIPINISRGNDPARDEPPQHRATNPRMPPPRRTMSGPLQEHPNVPTNPPPPVRPTGPPTPAPGSLQEPIDLKTVNMPTFTCNHHIQRQSSPPKPISTSNSTSAGQIPSKGTPVNQHSTPPNQILPQTSPFPVQQTDFQGPQQPNPHDPPVGFITSRAAEMINKQAPLPANARFNPKAESPSIPRTVGVNHSTSAPISRDAIKTGTTGTSATGPAANGVRPNAPNFINPSENIGRRIGMPGGGLVSPLNSNRTAYKPPSVAGGKRLYSDVAGPGQAAARIPLADVSNVPGGGHPVDVQGAGDAKKARMGET